MGSSNEAEPLGFDLKAPHLGRGGSLLLSHRKDLLAAHLIFDTLYTPPFYYIMERRENFLHCFFFFTPFLIFSYARGTQFWRHFLWIWLWRPHLWGIFFRNLDLFPHPSRLTYWCHPPSKPGTYFRWGSSCSAPHRSAPGPYICNFSMTIFIFLSFCWAASFIVASELPPWIE